jgi:hypothetical protein
MKHTKKMVMIPEIEYLTLLAMLKGDDPHKTEKATIEAKIQQNLKDNKISEDIKGRKYDWLLKQKRKLRELIDGKPQNVVIQNLPAQPNVAPYMGISQNQAPQTSPNVNTNDNKVKRRTRTRRNYTNSLPTGSSSAEKTDSSRTATSNSEGDYPSDATLAPSTLKTPRTNKTPSKYDTTGPTINPNLYNKLKAHISANKIKYGILDNGNVLTNFKAPVGGSDYTDSLMYLTGQIATPPKGFTFLKKRLYKDPEFIDQFGPQSGKGKINRKLIVVKINPIKTPGLKRQKAFAFKPKIWAKL